MSDSNFTKNTMSTATTDSLPPSEAGKPATGTKPAAKPTTKTPEAQPERIPTKSSPVNPAWAEEVVAEIGLIGSMGKKVAAELARQISDEILEKYTRPKLVKLTRKAVADAIV